MNRKIPFEYRITFIYILIGALWILFSDKLVVSMTGDLNKIRELSTYKGWFFVLVTGVLLFALVRRETKRRNVIQNRLSEANKKAVEADQLKTAFLSNLSHYVRSPMNSILGFVELLQDKDASETNRDLFLSYINDRSQHLLQTLSSIIEISKLQQGHVDVFSNTFHINELLKYLIENARLDIDRNHKNIELNYAWGLASNEDLVRTDSDKVKLVIVNLLTNALNFTEKGEVFLSYKVVGELIVVSVRDSGSGISAEKQRHLFNEFMATSSYICNVNEGAGLGLYLSTGVAKLIKGKIWLEQTDNNGSVFCFSFPYCSVKKESSSNGILNRLTNPVVCLYR
jgi:signal transduction histidine kinase